MNYIVFPEVSELNAFIVEKIREKLLQKPDALICLPAGESPLGVFNELIRLELLGAIDFSRAYFVSLDEWIGLGVNHPDSCLNFLDHHFFNHLNIQDSHICFFDGESNDPQKECQRIDEFIASRGGIDFLLAGVGMNGHLGLNEPGADLQLYSHVSSVTEITKEVAMKKYFDVPVELESGITLGLKHFTEAGEVVIMLSGTHKSEIAARIINGHVTADIPASLIRDCANVTFCLDAGAASKLK
jgi:glucosamine-6-phosphate isomerase